MSEESITDVVKSVKDLEPKTFDQIATPFARLIQGECWLICQDLLEKLLRRPDCSKSVYIEYIKLLSVHLNEANKATLMLQKLLQNFAIDFHQVNQEIFEWVLKDASPKTRAEYLEKVAGFFPNEADQVKCLEAVFFLYEKKLHDETKTNRIAERLIKIQALNLVALSYQRARALAESQWAQAAILSEKMLAAIVDEESRGRMAYQSASLYLSQLNQAQKAIDIIKPFTDSCPIDTAPLLFDAYTNLRNWSACIKILDGELQKAEDKEQKSKLYFHMGQLYERLGQTEPAQKKFQQSLDSSPTFLAPLEHLIQIQIEQKDKKSLVQSLGSLRKRLTRHQLVARVDKLLTSLATDYVEGK